jgi:hypothetical protein
MSKKNIHDFNNMVEKGEKIVYLYRYGKALAADGKLFCRKKALNILFRI